MENVKVVKVNDQEMCLKRMFGILKFTKTFDGIAESLIAPLLIKQESQSIGLEPTDEEIQKEADELRYSMNLESADDTFSWLKNNNLNMEDLEKHCECLARMKKFREHISQGKIDEYFACNTTSFETVDIAQIILDDESVAKELLIQLQNGEEHFESLARNYSIDYSAVWGGFVGSVKRSTLKPEFEAAVFSAGINDVVGPFKSERGFHIIKVLAHHQPELNDKAKEEIKNRILSAWIKQRRSKANIEFYL